MARIYKLKFTGSTEPSPYGTNTHELVSELNSKRHAIGATLRAELAAILPEGVSVESDIRFSDGSIAWSGVVTILDWMSRISGAVALLEMASHYIPLVINRILAPYFEPRGLTPDSTTVEVQSDPQILGSVVRPTTNDAEPLFPTRTILLAITAINAVLFMGGTIYTAFQVASIQKRYEDAIVKIDEAKQNYDRAELKLKSTEESSDRISTKLSDIQRQATESIADLEKQWTKSDAEIADIRHQSEQELDRVKKSSTDTLVAMSSYQKDTEAALTKAAEDVAIKLEQKIQFNKEAIKEKQASIDDLGLKISGLSTKVDQKDLELSRIQKRLEDQLDTAARLNAEFAGKIKSIARTDKITFLLAWRISDLFLKIIGVAVVVFLSLALILSMTSFRKAR